MLKITDKELHLKRPRDLRTSSRIAAFFIARGIRHHKINFLAFFFLAALAVAGQLGFLWVLQNLLGRLQDTSESEPFLAPLAGFAGSIPTPALIGLSLLTLLIIGLAAFANQWLGASLNSRLFLDNMRTVTARLVGRGGALGGSSLGENKLLANLYTKDCRYSGLIVSRIVNAIQPLAVLPFLLLYCIWLSPVLSMIAFLVMLLGAPLHLLLMQRGLVSMRGMRHEGARHGISKKNFLSALLEFPGRTGLDVEFLNRTYVEEESSGFLGYYFERRILAGWSTLINFIGAAIAITLTAILLFSADLQAWLAINLVLVFIVALRFMITSVGQIVTNFTTVVALTPLCERLYELLTGNERTTGLQLSPVAPDNVLESIATIPPGEFPAASILSVAPAKYLANLTEVGRSAVPTLVRSRYQPLYRDLKRDLLLPAGDSERATALASLPENIRDEIEVALATEQAAGWSPDLWERLEPAVITWATLRKALSEAGDHILMVGPVDEQLPPEMRDQFKAQLVAGRKATIQVFETFPRYLPAISADRLFVFDGRQIWPVRIDEGDELTLADLRRQYDRAVQIAALRSSGTAEPEDLSDEDEIT